jgi:sensor histidine kinase YesM
MGDMALRADDGTILKAKEAIVLDQNGEPVSYPHESASSFQSQKSTIRTIQLSSWLAPLLILAVGATLTLGTVFIGGLLLLFFVIGLIRLVLRSFGFR